MIVTPSPRGSSVVGGRDRAGRALRVTAHPEAGRVVVSTWQEGTCVSTVRLACADVPALVAALAGAAVACAREPAGPAGPAVGTSRPDPSDPAAGGATTGSAGPPPQQPPRSASPTVPDRSDAASGASAA